MKAITSQALNLAEQVPSNGYAGTLFIAQSGMILLNIGYGWEDKECLKPIYPDTRFWIASITKQFTAAAILKLDEDGLLSLSDSLDIFFTGVPSDKYQITLHQLLTHTAGLRQNYAADGITDRQAAVEAILSKPLMHAPGERFGYSNDAYNLLAAVIEVESSNTYEDCLKQLLLDPAGLENTGFWGTNGHETVAEIHKELNPNIQQANWGFRGAVGMFSNTIDLYRWYQVLQTGRILNAKSIKRLLGAQVQLRQDEFAGYGWFQNQTAAGTIIRWTRGTEGFGHNAILLSIPELEIVISAASNAGNINGIAASRHVVEKISDIFTAA